MGYNKKEIDIPAHVANRWAHHNHVDGVQGDILYHNGTSWVVLNAGADDYVLTTHGASANPTWEVGGGDCNLRFVAVDNVLGGNDAAPLIIAGTTVLRNTAIGAKALYTLEDYSGNSDNVVIGAYALYNSLDVEQTIAIGAYAGYAIPGTWANYNNIFIGYKAGYAVEGEYNTIIGDNIGLNGNAGNTDMNVIIGYNACSLGDMSSMNQNVVIGWRAGMHMGDDPGEIHWPYGNVIIGSQAGEDLTEGIGNVLIGSSAGVNMTIPYNNIAIGFAALAAVTEGDNNVAIGFDAGYKITTGQENNFLGNSSGFKVNTTSHNCLCIGRGPNTTAVYSHLGWIDDGYASDTPTLGFDFANDYVGILVAHANMTNILHVVASSATDPIADSWITHASSRKEKEIVGKPDDKKILDSIRKTEIYNYKRKVELIEAEKQKIINKFIEAKPKQKYQVTLTSEDNIEIENRINESIKNKSLKDGQKERIAKQVTDRYIREKTQKETREQKEVVFSEDDLKEIEKLHNDHLAKKSNLPKFTTERMGIMIDDDNVPSEILTFDEAGNKNGIDLLAYIGYLHGAVKALTAEVDILKGV